LGLDATKEGKRDCWEKTPVIGRAGYQDREISHGLFLGDNVAFQRKLEKVEESSRKVPARRTSNGIGCEGNVKGGILGALRARGKRSQGKEETGCLGLRYAVLSSGGRPSGFEGLERRSSEK